MKVYENIKKKTKLVYPKGSIKISTIDMHTGGEPLRVILGGMPELKGQTVLERRKYFKENHDDLRRAIMFEPRGHADMYGCVLVPPNDSDGDFGIIFLHNAGYSTMCGHAIIAISTLAVNQNWIDVREGENKILIDAPCGRITSFVEVFNQEVQGVKFHCVPSYVVSLDCNVTLKNAQKVNYDLAYGGAYYAYVRMEKNNFNFDLSPNSYNQLIEMGMDIKRAVINSNQEIKHPISEDLSFLYGTIFIGPSSNEGVSDRNVCIFAEGEVDRCPTGSGVSGRMAIHYKRKELRIGERMKIESIIDTTFFGSVVEEAQLGSYDAVVPMVEGTAYVTGKNEFVIDPKDPLREGFILR